MHTVKQHFVRAGVSALAIGLVAATPAIAQEEATGLQDIIVTAQKREQSLQDVPIAVTAIGGEALQANRIVSVQDLSGLAPGLYVAPTSGATKVPQFSMRGATGNGVVAGSDRQISNYLDGVYLSGSRGAIFDLPDIQRIEVLRGPQGTLFGRNATAGAISISTRDPTGEVGVRAQVTVGNFDQYRFLTSVDLPQVGPFSAYFSYLHSERRGDIRNTAAGMTWDRRNLGLPRIAKITRSPRFLGNENADSLFAAVKFESGDFTTVYKYDNLRSEGTPTGTAIVGYDNTGLIPSNVLTSNIVAALLQSQPFEVSLAPDGKRPRSVANGFSTTIPQRAQGHSVTSTYQFSDSLSIKNVFGYRTSFIFGPAPLDGVSALVVNQQSVVPIATLYGVSALARAGVNVADTANAALVQATIGNIIPSIQATVGQPFGIVPNQASGRTKQISDELQLNYDSNFLTATVGALWFNAKDWSNQFFGPTSPTFMALPGGVLPTTPTGKSFNEVTSIAAYAQLELHLNDQIDVILGGRITRDKKTGALTYGTNNAALSVLPFSITKTKPNYLIGVNYKPNRGTLIYAKYSTAYVSGGSVVGIPYSPETAKSAEAGIKAELFDRKLRANLALFWAKYKGVQGAQGSTTPGSAEFIAEVTGDPDRASVVSTFVQNLGDITAKGFEFDLEAAPVEGITMGGSLGYTHTSTSNIPANLLASQGGRYELLFRPDWTGSLWAQYDTPRLGNSDAYLSIRGDARWQSDMNMALNPDSIPYQTFARTVREVPAYWLFNGRVALKDLDLGGVKTEVAVWGKNLANNRSANYSIPLGFIAQANFNPARTYGLDLTVQF